MEKEAKVLRRAFDMIKVRNDEVEKELNDLKARSDVERIRSAEVILAFPTQTASLTLISAG